jgi:transcriptional regulator with XRE-family HTH domain
VRSDSERPADIRKAAQMTQVEVARKLGVGQGAISRLEGAPTCCCRPCMTT